MLVPYMFQGNQVAMTWVFMKGFSKAAKVVGMTNTGKVQVKVGLSVMEAPPQVAFAQCPSCRREHTQMERYCKGCKESMVYYPLPKTNVRRALEKMNRTKTKKEKKVITTESVTVRSGVTSSCSHYLHEVFEFESKSALKCAEAEVRRVIERSCNSKQLKPPETAYWVDRYNPSDADMGFLRKLDCKSKYSEVPLPEIAAGYVEKKKKGGKKKTNHTMCAQIFCVVIISV